MSGYPPAASYGPPPGLTTLTGQYQPQHGNNTQQHHYQQYDNTQYNYSQHQSDPNVNAFSNNAAYQGGYQNSVPPFSAAAVASGVPPLPIYSQQWQMDNNPQQYGTPPFWAPPQQQQPAPQWNQPPQQNQLQQPQQQSQQHQPQQPQHTHFDQQGFAPYEPYNTAMHLNNTSGPSPMSFTPQPIMPQQSQPPAQPQQPQIFAPPTGPRPKPLAEDGELSEGEYVPSPQRLPSRNRGKQRPSKKSFDAPKQPAAIHKQKEDIPFPDQNGRRVSRDWDHYSPPQQLRRTSFSGQSSQSSQERQGEMRGGASNNHKRKPAQARKETAREAAKQKTPPASRRQSISKPAVEKVPLPAMPTLQAPTLQRLEDARKQAQNAVLNLLPLKVRFDNYLEEGIKEEIITKVFADVGLTPTRETKKVEKKAENKPVSKPASSPQVLVPVFPGLSAVPASAPKTALPEKPVLSPPKEKADHLPSLGNRKPSVATAAPGDKAEERKDRIARLLAAKNNKTVKPEKSVTETVVPVVAPAPVVAPVVAPPTISSPAPPPPMKHPLPPKPTPHVISVPEASAPDVVVAAAPKVDKDALLRQKMVALQQKSAADKDALLRKKLEEMDVSKPQKPMDKDAILRQKMENLRKSREKREQEANANQPSPQESSSDQSTSGGPPLYGMQASAFNPFAAPFQSSLPPLPPYPPHQTMPFIPGLGIPGLSFGAQPSEPSPQPASVPAVSAALVNSRKRPVASDFDSSASTPQPYKKPFGHVQQDSCVIDVSDESEDEEDEEDDTMELDEAIDRFGRNANMASKPNMRDLPPLSDFPPKRSYTAPSSAVGTPPISQSLPHPSARPEDLKRKELAIQEMRRKIAEAEERKKAKLASVGSSNSTPQTPASSSNEIPASIDRIVTSNEIECLMSDASKKIEEDQQKLAETQMLQEQKALDLKNAQEEQRRKRQAELAANLPAVDADVQETQRRLAEMRAEMQRLEADMQKKLDDKRRLAEEMEKLNVEADEHLEAQKEQLQEINNDIAIVEQVAAVGVSESVDADISADANKASSSSDSENLSFAAQENTEAGSPESEVQAAPQTAEPINGLNNIKVHSSLEDKIDDEIPQQASDRNSQVSHDTSPTKSIEVSRREVEMSSGSESTPMIESSESSRESESMDRGVSVQQRDSSSSDSSDQSMEESSSAEMEIDETPAQIARLPAQTEESSSEESLSEDSSGDSDDDSDSDDAAQQDDGVQAAIQDAEMPDASDTSSDESSGEEDEEELEPEAASSPKAQDVTVGTSPANQAASYPTSSNIPGLQHTVSQPPAGAAPTVSAPVQKSVAAVQNSEVDTMAIAPSSSEKKGSKFFTPYQSPLKSFHAYRFHPCFTSEVQGGYKSLTFSNNIKDKEEFCRYELAGGACNDPKCDMQHFKDVQLTDGAILEVLGNPKGLAEDEKMRFITGLKQVLSEMRAQNVRSFDKIAANIVAFRHEFFDGLETLFPDRFR